eukprot:Tbor_TRINITY_DN5741_c1_g2::TRINITY_DN5741_c1_g2_i1::g.20955::m.20955
MTVKQAPFLICFIPQFISVMGDCVGSRSARVYITKQSRRRFIFALVFVSSIQMFIALSIFQMAAPDLTTAIYKTNETTGKTFDWCKLDLSKIQGNHTQSNIYSTSTNMRGMNCNGFECGISHLTSVDNIYNLSGISLKHSVVSLNHNNSNDNSNVNNNSSDSSLVSNQRHANITLTAKYTTTLSPEQKKYCFPQGPLSIPENLHLCPMLLINGCVNIFYYIGEACMYKQPLGVLLLVLSALASSFIIAPFEKLFEIKGAEQVNVWAVLCGIVGAVLCLIERTPPIVIIDDGVKETHESGENSEIIQQGRACTIKETYKHI